MSVDSAKKAAQSVWGATPAGSTLAPEFQRGTKEFFDSVIERRFSGECKWLYKIARFDAWKNKDVLEIGCGAGYDAYQFCKNGARYTGIDITHANIGLARKHLSLYNFSPCLYQMDAEFLNFEQQFDYVYSFGVIHHIPNIEHVLQNIFNSLKPNGKTCLIVYNKYSIFYILQVAIFDWFFKLKFLKMSLAERRSMIEYSTSKELAHVTVYSKRNFCKLIGKAGFKISAVNIRQLKHADLPYIFFISKFYKYLPQAWLDRLGNYWGWFLCVEAEKIAQ